MESTGCLHEHPFYMLVRVRVRACCNGHYDMDGGIDEGVDGVTIFSPAKIWALGSTYLVMKRALVENYLLELGWRCQAPFLPI